MGSMSDQLTASPPIVSPLLSDAEAHKLVAPSLGFRTWVQLRLDGKIPFMKVGRRVLVNVDKAREALESSFTVKSSDRLIELGIQESQAALTK